MKKTFRLSLLLAVLMSMVSNKAFAYDIVVNNEDGVKIYYNYISDGHELEVTYLEKDSYDNRRAYKGTVNIPDEVTYLNRTRKVTEINRYAFCYCSDLTSITIPGSVTYIGEEAFYGCSNLTKVIVEDIASWCNISFYNNPLSSAHHLYSDENTEITNLVIPESVTSIGDWAFVGCSSLTSVTIPNSVTSIGAGAFDGCKSLTSVTIPNSVTSIGGAAFASCSGLTSVTIPNSVTSIGAQTFASCIGLTSVTIPISVTIIGDAAFHNCSGLTSITIPNSVTSIGYQAFKYCKGLTSVISLIENPFAIEGKTFDNRTFDLDTYNNATLYVPKGTIDKYKATEGWKDFLFMEEGGSTGGGETPGEKKCAKPTISYANKQLKFSCKTEGVEYVYEITDADIKTGKSSMVNLTATYNISVYATKSGMNNSDVATATLVWIEAEFTTNESSGVKPMLAAPVLIQANDGQISVEGAPEGTKVAVYDVNGVELGAAISRGGRTIVPAHIASGSIAIVKIGQKAVKIMKK